MAKRTDKKVESDYRKIKKYVDTHNVRSLNEISSALNLTVSQVNTSLSRHVRVQKSIREMISRNAEEGRDKNQANMVLSEKEASFDNESSRNKVKECNSFVIDASITGSEELFDSMKEISSKNGIFILTSVTIKELEKMQRYYDTDGNDARRILALAADNEEMFQCVLIDETLETPDDCIISYCASHKDEVALLTSDKAMGLKARAYGVQTRFLKQPIHTNAVSDKKGFGPLKKLTIYDAKIRGGALIIDKFSGPAKKIRIISDGIEYNAGIKSLKVGDEVFIATKKQGFITFAHYKMISLLKENHCIWVFGKRIYKQEDIENLPKGSYKSFIRDFAHEMDF